MIRNIWDGITEAVIEQAAMKALGLSGLGQVEACHPTDIACVERTDVSFRVRILADENARRAHDKAQCQENERLNNYRLDLHCEKYDPLPAPSRQQVLSQVRAGVPDVRTATGEEMYEATRRIFETAVAEPDRPEFVSPAEQPRPTVAAPAPAPREEQIPEQPDGGFKFELPKAITSQPWYVYAIVAAGLALLFRK